MSRGLRSRVGDRSRLGVSGDDTTAPTITSLDVSTGTYLGGTEVTITGTGFNDVTAVSFNGVAADSFTVDSDTQITATTDASDDDGLGLGDVVVTDPYGSDTLTNGWTYSVLDGATESWLASLYSGSGPWSGAKGVADFALPGGSNDPTFLPYSTSSNPFGAGVDHVALPGTSGNYVSTPDAAALDITGDITLVAWVAADDWTPAATLAFIAKNDGGTNRSFALTLDSSGMLRIGWFTDGTVGTATLMTATDATGITDGTASWVAASLDVNDGAGNRVAKFWKSSDGVSWSQIGSTVTTAGTTSIFAGTAVLEVGSIASGTVNCLTGSVARAQVYSGVRDFSGTPSGGTLVADFNPNGGTYNSTYSTLTSTGDGLTWTFNRSTSGRRLAVVDRDWWWLGTDDYLTTPDNALFDFGANQDFTVGVLFRAIQDADSNYHYLLSKRSVGAIASLGWGVGVGGTGTTEEVFFVADDTSGAPDLCYDDSWNTPGALQTHISTRLSGTGTVYTDTVAGANTSAANADPSNTLAVSVGRVLTTAGASFSVFDGLIGGIAIFRTGLTATQVTQLDAELRALA